ncbi:MAG TPA: S-methyl-5'-thioadenosine phosphorylase [Anaerohalosphaeraceae bacterium]|nr:S-methyl-5'-thioadenosine phosphorylase [Anaerohalosphaeraceae bacterium]HOL88083.1 S-methyl-5'-thioadenosine phosphorylase [Anaerohalosphaeraceae bacterium]HPP55331.1 S-methyl-5'-thioadenosine phosphorylase [Anaerohalosphaeraceae bacterium]
MDKPQIAVIGGTGLGDGFAARLADIEEVFPDTPFGKPSAPVQLGTFAGRRIAFLNRHGQGHCLNPSRIPYAANIFALKSLGVRTILASGAVGSLREEYAPKEVVLADQFIDKTFRRQSSFFDALGAVHVEFAQPCCARLRRQLLHVSRRLPFPVHPSGTYVCMEGPQFSTRAESQMHRQWGADLIGMTALPEAKLAREAQMCYALLALITDYDCWRPHDPNQSQQSLLQEIIGNLHTATDNAVRLLEELLAGGEPLADDRCPCRHALELAVWTRPEAQNADERRRLRPLWE